MSADIALLTTESRRRLASASPGSRRSSVLSWRAPRREDVRARVARPEHVAVQFGPPGWVRCNATSGHVVGSARSSRERRPLGGALSSSSRSSAPAGPTAAGPARPPCR